MPSPEEIADEIAEIIRPFIKGIKRGDSEVVPIFKKSISSAEAEQLLGSLHRIVKTVRLEKRKFQKIA